MLILYNPLKSVQPLLPPPPKSLRIISFLFDICIIGFVIYLSRKLIVTHPLNSQYYHIVSTNFTIIGSFKLTPTVNATNNNKYELYCDAITSNMTNCFYYIGNYNVENYCEINKNVTIDGYYSNDNNICYKNYTNLQKKKQKHIVFINNLFKIIMIVSLCFAGLCILLIIIYFDDIKMFYKQRKHPGDDIENNLYVDDCSF